jgi:deoxycytidine triphosphate deaminase
MAILTERSFRDYQGRLLAIYPMREECITGVGYDLTVGYYVKVNRPLRRIVAHGTVDPHDNDGIKLEPETYLVVITREYVYLSSRIAATFHSKSSLAAQAIFMNSTTGDPNWDGRLIFLLYNASGTAVEMELSKTCATLVAHTVERRSTVWPTNPKVVLSNYLKGFDGELKGILDYVNKIDAVTHEYLALRDRAMKYSSRPLPLILLHAVFRRYLRPRLFQFVLVIVGLTALAVSLAPPQYVFGLAVDERMLSRISSWASIISLALALVTMLRRKKAGASAD